MAWSASETRASGSASWVISRTPQEMCSGADHSPNFSGSASMGPGHPAGVGPAPGAVGLDQDHGELVAPHAPDDVAFADVLLQALGHGLQRRVPRGVAQAVVHAF